MREVQRFGLGGLLCLAVLGFASPGAAATRLGAVAGAHSGLFSGGTDDTGMLHRESRWAWAGGGGLRVEHALSPRLALATGIEYVETPDVARLESTLVGSVTWRIRRHEVAVPLLVELRRGPWRAGLGPQVRYLLSARRTSEDFEPVAQPAATAAASRPIARPAAQIFEEVGTFDGSGDATDFYERWTVALQGGVGRAWAAGGHELRADLRAAFDLTSAGDRFGGDLRGAWAGFAIGLLW